MIIIMIIIIHLYSEKIDPMGYNPLQLIEIKFVILSSYGFNHKCKQNKELNMF